MAVVKQKVTMVDDSKTIVDVKLNATSPNELIGGHTIYSAYGIIEFTDGKSKVTKELADKLKEEKLVK